MKKTKWFYGLAALLWMGSTAVLRAQDMGPGNHPSADQPGMEDGMGGGPGGGAGQWKEKLGLSDDQATQVKDLFKKNREEMKPLRDQLRIDMDTLRQKVDTKASDADIKKLLDTLSADRDKMQAGRKKMETQLKGILTPIQQAKMVLAMQGRARQMMGKRKGPGQGDGKGPGNDDGSGPAPSVKADGGDHN